MAEPDPTLRADAQPEDADRALRPQTLESVVGQAAARANLAVFIESARRRGEAMDHALFYGPPGLGKTTLAQIMARELGVSFRMTSGPVLAKAGDLAAILTNLDTRDVLFIDEIHRLNPAVEEVLYPAMEDYALDLVSGEGPAARTVRIDLPPFTLVGATTRLGLLTTPLRDRFGIPTRLEFYTVEELVSIVTRAARLLKAEATPDGALEIARRAPRRYEHPCKETRLGRPGTCLQLNVKVEVFVYEKHENSGISKAQITHNRAQMRALRQVVGADWAFLEEDDVDDILRRTGERDDDFDRRPPVFRWNFA